MTKGAGILFVSLSGNALFLRRSSTARDCPGCWDFPGGTCEGEETPEQCAVRECREEIGFVPEGARALHVRQKFVPQLKGTTGAAPAQAPNVPPSPTPAAAAEFMPSSDVDFTTFVQKVTNEFTPELNDEHDGWAWAPIAAPPLPLHPGCLIALDRLGMNELDVARAIADGRLTSPQRVENVQLFALRITGTGYAYRPKHDEFVFRPPEKYLNEEFLARCNGLQVIYQHPASTLLNSDEFEARTVGAVFLPYISGDEVWGIAKIYDDDAAAKMAAGELSTSPAVFFRDLAVNHKMTLENGARLLVEGDPSLLDHVALCERGVWDKGEEPSGIRSESRKDSLMPEMTEEEAQKKFGDAVARGDAKKKGPLEGFEAGGVFHPIRSSSGYSSRKAGDSDETYKARHDAEESEEAAELEKAGASKDASRARAAHHRRDAEEDEKRKSAENDVSKKLDAIADALGGLHKRMDAVEESEKKRGEADKARKDAEEGERRKKGDPEQLAADKARKDAEEAETKAAADKARKDAEDKAKADAADIKKRIDEVAAMVKPIADDDHAKLADAWTRADDIFTSLGKPTPRAMQGETAAQYNRRITKMLQPFSPRWKDIDLSSQAFADEAAFNVASGQVFADAAEVSHSAATAPANGLRMITRNIGGHIHNTFVGEPNAWMNQFAGPVKFKGKGSWKHENRGA